MKVLYNWLKEYVNIKDSPYDLADVFTRLGMEVEEISDLREGLLGLKTALIEDVRSHPKKENYSIVKLHLKDGNLTCVSGSSGLKKGRFVFVATPGTLLPGGKVDKKDVFGVISEGNIISLEDIGLEDTSDTVFFPEDVNLDTSPVKYLGLDDFLYDLYITPNRPDLLGYLGIAADLAAYYDEEVHIPPYGIEEYPDLEVPPVRVMDFEGCPRYTGRVISGVTVKESPLWLKRKLYLSGIRPISNVVDVTNYVLLELGHPLHAFDLKNLDEEVIIRKARKGEKILALDGKEYLLDEENLVIADKKCPIAIAGIIGGEESSINECTESVFLESAYFEPSIVSKGVFKFNLRTESGIRFMKGADICIPPIASSRATRLIIELAGGKASKIVDVKKDIPCERKIFVRIEKISGLLGEEVEERGLLNLLDRLGFTFDRKGRGVYELKVPSRRRDIEGEPDIAEEYLRFMGFDIVGRRLHVPDKSPGDLPLDKWFFIKNLLFSQGYWEARTVEFISLKEHLWFSKTQPIEIANPLSPEMSVMRPSLLPGLLKSGALNIRYGNENVKLFELGRVFINKAGKDTPFTEVMHLAAFVGGYSSRTLYERKRRLDFYDIKGILDVIARYFSIKFVLRESREKMPGFSFSVDIVVNDKKVGVIGEVSHEVLKFLEVKYPLFVMEMDADVLDIPVYKYHDFSRFPAVYRDISLLVPRGTMFGEVKNLIESADIPYLTGVNLVDVFENRKVLGDKVSFTISLRFESTTTTLESKVVDTSVDRVLNLLRKHGYEQRT